MLTSKALAKELRSISSKLKSAWALQVGFETRLDGLLPAIAALPSGEIDQHIDAIAKGDIIGEMTAMLIASEHLHHPSLHHRISDWIASDTLPYRERLIRAIGRFALRDFAELLNSLYLRHDSPDSMNTWHAALWATPRLESKSNYEHLLALLGSERNWVNMAIANAIRRFPEFDGEKIYGRWFRESEVIDQIAVCNAFLKGDISAVERMQRSDEAHFIWEFAERYAEFAKREVFDFLLEHLNFDQTCFNSERLSQTIVCRGRVATCIIARVNGWWVDDHESTKESAERNNAFVAGLWQSLQSNPNCAYADSCPVDYTYPYNHKIHQLVESHLSNYDQVLKADPNYGFSLRESQTRPGLLLAIQRPYWRFVMPARDESDAFRSGEVTAHDLFFRYSSKGALVAFADQVVLNANDLENKWAKGLLKKATRKKDKEA